jgi:DNA-binding NarL/FixJ family response regulator
MPKPSSLSSILFLQRAAQTGFVCLRILLADDSVFLRAGVRTWLETKRNWKVDEASDAAEAISKIKAGLPDVVILDVSLPGASGIEVAEAIRQLAPSVKIVFFTSYDQTCLTAAGFASTPFVSKSSAVRELIPMIESIADPARL